MKIVSTVNSQIKDGGIIREHFTYFWGIVLFEFLGGGLGELVGSALVGGVLEGVYLVQGV